VILGIDVEEGSARAVVIEDNPAAVARATSSQRDAVDAIVQGARDALSAAKASSPGAVGVASPDPQEYAPAVRSLAAAVGSSIPILTTTTGNATVIAEVWGGAARGARHAVAFSVARRVSAGVIIDGALLSGAHGLASSIGWLALNPVEREDYRRLGCLEAEGGAAGIVRRLVWRIKSGDHSRVLDMARGDFSAIQLDDVLTAARNGDGVSISVIRDTVKYLAMAVSNIAAVVDPEVIVLGGIIQSAGDLLLEPIRQECARRMPQAMLDRVRIELTAFGDEAAAIGAARFAMLGGKLA
jgi:glucokinase